VTVRHRGGQCDDDAAFHAALARIDWSQPWLAPIREDGRRWAELAGASAWRAQLTDEARARSLRNGTGVPLKFVSQQALPPGVAYEAHIAATGGVPTRANLHDFFNAAIWFAFPRIKATLNALQAADIAQFGVSATRGGRRDALTLFDENAALFVTAEPTLADALRRFDWATLFVASRAAWRRRCDVLLFGHALLEKLVAPYKGCTAHAWICRVPDAYFEWPDARRRAYVDAAIASALLGGRTKGRAVTSDGRIGLDGLDGRALPELPELLEESAAQASQELPEVHELPGMPLSTACFAPLPVLGIPGWCADNRDPCFYDDRSVFRNDRLRRPDDKMMSSKAG